MKVRLEQKVLELNKDTEIPDYSYNHYYNFVSGNQCIVTYLVPSTKEDAIKAMSPKSQKERP